MKAKRRLPKLRLHKATGQGYVELAGRRIYLGKYGLPATQERYVRELGEWVANGYRARVRPSEVTVAEVVAAYVEHVNRRYRSPDGEETAEAARIVHALRPLVRLYGATPAAAFGPRALKAVRQAFLDGSGPHLRGPLCRSGVNAAVSRVKGCFKWATAEEMIPRDVFHGLLAVDGLRRGTGEARETEPVRPVPEAHVEAVRPLVSSQVRALIDLQLLTGARPGEVCRMRPCDIDRSGKVWLFRLEEHKTSHHGAGAREIYLGPKAQAVLAPFLLRDAGAYCFSPREAEEARRERAHAARTTPPSCGNVPNSNRKRRPEVAPGELYDVHSYRRAIARACAALRKAGKDVPTWSPNRLRHNAATALRREYGVDLAGVILGHRHGSFVTAVYAEADRERARKVVGEVG